MAPLKVALLEVTLKRTTLVPNACATNSSLPLNCPNDGRSKWLDSITPFCAGVPVGLRKRVIDPCEGLGDG